ncbi:hypothetical protein IVA80_24995 [Bradyrhizobium sp. 139]|uniref:hypothetical protein n=1 Tax=Bradyrhizobium sp. 139 TaxID=2782616 RepID=UPI001FF8FFF0|nr:hypothetical protein [Bradyrhizobium sp. 139]MCK1744005.1 hypothetical protein [Bradyrhizobium sp. 139]
MASGFLLLFGGSIEGYRRGNKKPARRNVTISKIIMGLVAITCLWPAASPAEIARSLPAEKKSLTMSERELVARPMF